MGSGSTRQTTTPQFSSSTQTTTPWAPQADALTKAFKDAQSNYDALKANPFTGEYAAGPTSTQYDAYGNVLKHTNDQQNTVDGMLSQGSGNATTGYGAAADSLGGLGSFLSSDRVGAAIDAAKRYAGGFDVNAAMLDANRNAAENDIPSLYRSAAGAGGINSDRAALAQGVVERGLAEKKLQLANDNYTAGLGFAHDDTTKLLQALGLMGSQGQALGNSGVADQTGAIDTQHSLDQQATGAADALHGLDQAKLDAILQNYLGPSQLQNQNLQSLYGLIGDKGWGKTETSSGINSGGTTTQQTTPSIGSYIAGGLGTLGSLIKR